MFIFVNVNVKDMTEKTKEFLQKLKDSGNWNDNKSLLID